MARDVESLPPEARVRREVGRRLANVVVVAICLAILGSWGYFGFYQLEPGQAAVILQFGRYVRTVSEPGLKWHWPPPIESHDIVNVASIEREEFGYRGSALETEASGDARLEAAMQTSDNNVVHVGFVVQYRIKDAFQSRYRVAKPRETLRDAAQAAIREVVGSTSIDGVLSEKRGLVELETEELLQAILDRYEAGVEIQGVQLQEVQPPQAVSQAFNDVVAAIQDRSRSANEAESYANEVLPHARAEGVELREAARARRDATVAEATGRAARFRAVLEEYRKAPDVTRKRLYLETMEEVLPNVEKVIVEPGTAQVFPYLPLMGAGRAGESGGGR